MPIIPGNQGENPNIFPKSRSYIPHISNRREKKYNEKVISQNSWDWA